MRVVLACIVGCAAALLVAGAGVAKSAGPEVLWRAYPLEQAPSRPSAGVRPLAAQPMGRASEASSTPSPALALLAAASGAALVLAALAVRPDLLPRWRRQR